MMLIFIGGIGLTGYYSIHNVNENLQDIFAVRLPSLDYLLEVDRDLQQLLVAERSIIFATPGSDLFRKLVKEYEDNLQQSAVRWEKFKALATSSQEQSLVAQHDAARKAWTKLSRQVVQASSANTEESREKAMALTMGGAQDRFEEMRDKLDQLTELNLAMADAASNAAQATYRSANLTTVAMVVGSIAAGILLALFIGASITRPINAAVAGLKDIAQGEGDLTKRLAVVSRDEVGSLSHWFNTFLDKLQNMVRLITEDAGSLAGSAQTLTTVSDDMTQGADAISSRSNTVAAATEEMSANITSVAAAMEQTATNMESVSSAAEQMNCTIAEIAKHTETARMITNQAVTQTKDTSHKMDQLGEAARSITKVTEVITEISDQTNLLALNATIEAARAGEAGKGFAVVANEIKELAKQTAGATQEIKEKTRLIQGSTEETIQQISTISKVINDINEIVSTISSATEEQSTATKDIAVNVTQASTGLQEVNQNVAQSSTASADIAQQIAGINQGVSDMSSRCSQVNSSALALRHLADKLSAMMGNFKV